MLPGHSWDEFLSLAVTEIRLYGASAPQVCRRLRAVLDQLLVDAPAEHRAAIRDELRRLDESIDRAFAGSDLLGFARRSDRQGIGGRTEPASPAVPRPRSDAEATAPGGGG